MLRYFSILILSLTINTVCLAQVGSNMITRKKGPSASPQNFLDLTLTMGIPMDDYASTTTSLPFGVSCNYLYQPSSKVPFLFGGGLTFLSAGSKTINKDLTADITLGSTLIDQLVIPLEFSIRNQIVNGHAQIRIQATNDIVKPYLDILGGFNYFWTSTTLYDRSTQNYFQTDDKDRIFHKTQLRDLAWSGGAGVGIMARLSSTVYLNLGATYMFGGKLDYFDKEQISQWNIELNSSSLTSTNNENQLGSDDVNILALPKRSVTTMLFANAGVCFLLNGSSNSSGPKKRPGPKKR
jgi:hypothetical protein